MTAPPGYPLAWDPVLVNRFLLRHADNVPDRVAIVAHGHQHTYADLATSARHYGGVLHEAGLRHGDPVAVLMEPGFESVAILLACGEAGYVYVPLNADLPEPRVAQICHRVGARLAVFGPGADLSPDDGADLAPGRALARGDTLTILSAPTETATARRRVLESDTAYVVFTSGSTGVPKGVTMSHRAAVVAMRGIANGCATHPRLASVSPLGFDMSLLDTAAALGTAATIHFVPRRVTIHPYRFLDFLREHRIQQLHAVPTLIALLVRYGTERLGELDSLRRIITGGEEVTLSLITALRDRLPDLDIGVMYGQTESICCAFGHLPNPLPADQDTVPLGDPYPGAELLLFDTNGTRITEPDTVGEIYLRAASLFDGYWRDPDSTAHALVPDPERPHSGERLLRTGDLARLTAHGFVFAGRRDQQVQIYGNRVELPEIERCIAGLPHVHAVAVIDHTHGIDHTLTAVVVADQPIRGDTNTVRDHCRTHLPAYMVPARIHFVDHLPQLRSGKIDRGALA